MLPEHSKITLSGVSETTLHLSNKGDNFRWQACYSRARTCFPAPFCSRQLCPWGLILLRRENGCGLEPRQATKSKEMVLSNGHCARGCTSTCHGRLFCACQKNGCGLEPRHATRDKELPSFAVLSTLIATQVQQRRDNFRGQACYSMAKTCFSVPFCTRQICTWTLILTKRLLQQGL